MCLEFIRTILYGRFHGIYLVKAIHSQNSVIHAGFCSFLLHWSDRWWLPFHTLPYSFLYCMTDSLIRLKCLQLLLRFFNTKLCNNLHYFVVLSSFLFVVPFASIDSQRKQMNKQVVCSFVSNQFFQKFLARFWMFETFYFLIIQKILCISILRQPKIYLNGVFNTWHTFILQRFW